MPDKPPLHVGEPHQPSWRALSGYLQTALQDNRLTNDGSLVRELEEKLAEYLGVKHVVCVSSGTVGLQIAAKALGLAGEVILPSWTFVATASALQWIDLKPVFADVGLESQTLYAPSALSLITSRTKAIMGVHTWGQPCDPALERMGVPVIYDAAHAFGVSGIAEWGSCAVFSFHATKTFSTIEGGCVAANDDALAAKCRLMRNFGFDGEDSVTSIGINAKMSEFHAAYGLALWDDLPMVMENQQARYGWYRQFIPPDFFMVHSPNHQYISLLTANRDRVWNALRREGILARRYFFPGIHNIPTYMRGIPPILPHTDFLSQHNLVLPNGPSVDREAIKCIANIIERVGSPVSILHGVPVA